MSMNNATERKLTFRSTTESERTIAQLRSFFCGLMYLSTRGPAGENYEWYFKNGVMVDVQYCFQYAGMA